jgi:FAD/FMN-containing dehydrogenase
MHDALRQTPQSCSRKSRIPVHSAPQLRSVWRETRAAGALDLRPLDRVLRLDSERGLLEVHAGARWEAIAAWLASECGAGSAWALPIDSGGLAPETVGESVWMNAPGYGATRGPIADDVEAMTLLAADGELHRLSRSDEPRLFGLVLGGYGLFGLLYSVTLRLAPRGATIAQDPATQSLLAPLSPCGAPGNATTHAMVRLHVPAQRSGQFILAALDAANEHRVVISRAAARRVIETQTNFLHPRPADRIEFTLQLCRSANLCARVRLEEACRRLADLALELGGGLSLSHGTYASRPQVETSYPMLAGFLAEKHRHDPAGHFNNAWSRHYTQLVRREACAMRWAA